MTGRPDRLKQSAKQFPKSYAFTEKAAKRAEQELEKHRLYQRALDAGLSLTSWRPGSTLAELEEMYRSALARKVPGIAASERAYVSYLNAMRMAHFEALYTALEAKEGGLTDANLKAIANHVNALTGRGNIKGMEKAAEAMAMVLFSPRYWWSRLQVLGGFFYSVADAASGFKWFGENKGDEADTAARKIIAIERGRLALGLTAMYSLIKAASFAMQGLAGDDEEPLFDVSFNLLSTDFGKIKFSNGTRVDTGAGLLQNAVYLSQLWKGKRVSSVTGEMMDFRGDDRDPQRDDFTEGVRMFRKKASPTVSAIFDLSYRGGEDVLGQPVLPESEFFGLYIPISVQEANEAYSDLGLSKGSIALLLNLFGFGSQTYGTGDEPAINSTPDNPALKVLSTASDERKLAEVAGRSFQKVLDALGTGIVAVPPDRYDRFYK